MFISLEKACELFEKYKLKNDIKESITMMDCLVRNHIICRLPLYIKNDNGEYEETEDDIATITSDIFIDYEDIYYFCDKELMPQMGSWECCCSCCAPEDENEDVPNLPSPIAQLLRPGLDAIIGKRTNYAAAIDYEEIRKEYSTSGRMFFDIYEKPHILAKLRGDPIKPLEVEMKYMGYKE